MHIFLTGEIQIGKSTSIRKAVGKLGIRPGGFLTEFAEDRNLWPRTLYLKSPDGQRQSAAARIWQDRPPVVYVEAFEQLGVELLKQRTGHQMLLMDECGRFEQQAPHFRQEVMSALDDQIPVLGVIRKLPYASWLDEIKAHPKVTLIEVTEKNRDGLCDSIADRLLHYLL